jgi:structural maintenance of chromosome 3 (chondroitin sulfate proteoglycan 6)
MSPLRLRPVSPPQLRAISAQQEELQEVRERGAGAAAEESRRLESLLAKQTTLNTRCEDLSHKIRNLGTLPEEAFEKFRKKPTKVRLA